jgi:hypothetical protein
VEEIINLGLEDLSKGNMFTCSKWHPPHWMWLQVMWFCMFGRSYLPEYCCWRVGMVKNGRTVCIIVCHVIFPMWMAILTHPWPLYLLVYDVCCVGSPHELPLCWFVTSVQEDDTWHVWHRPWTKYQLANGFAFDAPIRCGSHCNIIGLV